MATLIISVQTFKRVYIVINKYHGVDDGTLPTLSGPSHLIILLASFLLAAEKK